MCGITGVMNLSGDPLADPLVAQRMAASLVHRGPDEQGSMVDGPVAFGFRRLRIIDLETGQQPVSNEDATVWCMLNGEVYNYVELRSRLLARGHEFHSQSDTEVIVHAYEEYGLEFVQHLRGMFAIALWDRPKQRLVLARDRIGKKPLFYSARHGELAFASELKALLAWPHLDRTINAHALHDYLTFLYVPAPDAIFQGVHKLPAGHVLVADCSVGAFCLTRYWRLSPRPDRSQPADRYREGLRRVLEEAVSIRLRSDVPLGAFLSGGVDSTIITGLMAREVTPVRTFSIGFVDPQFDETPFARRAASSLGTLHTERVVDASCVSPEEFFRLVWHMDEPFGDSSFIPTYWLCRTAREHVTVALSGDGGDELFAGHNRYRHFQRLGWLSGTPALVRRAGGSVAHILRRAALPVSPTLAERMRQVQKAIDLSALTRGDQLFALLTYLDEATKTELYSREWQGSVNGYTSRERLGEWSRISARNGDALTEFLATDVENTLVDDSLVKVDRASMACSLEVRSPFLDHRVAEFAMRIPPEYKLRNGSGKAILKDACADLLPREIAHRGKQGFEVPFARWFQTDPWRTLLIDLLSESRLRRQGILDPGAVVAMRDALLSDPEGRNAAVSAYQLRHRVWALFVFQAWYDQFMG